jgi:membrane-bound lytic murein transglycosylase B
MRRVVITLLSVMMAPGGGLFAAQLDGTEVTEFINYMVSTHGFVRDDLDRIFKKTQRSDRVLALMQRPAEKAKPWSQYRSLFVTSKRIRDGVDFWNRNDDALARAAVQYGVAPEVIVAIIGVETSYGRISGNHRVMDALATLAFHYPSDNPKRSNFFRTQLEQFLLFTREDKLDPLNLTGSYAGAMGMPQFMPESYRKLAIDFDGDGARSIWSNSDDAIGSVANYLSHHGWQQSGPVTSPAKIVGGDPSTFLKSSMKPTFRLAELIAAGITPVDQSISVDEEAALFELDGASGNEYWVGYTNFYVISRYNPRVKYAMAVAHLSEAIRNSRGESGS